MFLKVTVLEAGLGCSRLQDTAEDPCVESNLQGGVCCSVWVVFSVAVGFPWGVTTRRKWEESTASQGALSQLFTSTAAWHFFPPLGAVTVSLGYYLGTGDPVEPLMG